MTRVIALGGGISGLTAAFLAQRALRGCSSGSCVQLVESAQRVGGWVCSSRSDTKHRFLFEQGPHSMRPKGPSGLSVIRLLEELGLETEALATSPKSKKRYIWTNGTMHDMSGGIWAMMSDQILRKFLLMAVREAFFVARRSNDGSKEQDESVYAFFNRRFGREIADNIADAMVQGIFAGDSRQLSLASCFPLLAEIENTHGSIVRGMLTREAMDSLGLDNRYGCNDGILKTESGKELSDTTGISFPQGMQRLVDELVEQTFGNSDAGLGMTRQLLQGKEKKVVRINRDCTVELADGSIIKCDYVLSALPLRALVEALPETEAAILKPLSDNTRYASVGVVNLAYANMKIPQSGFGHLVPTNQQEGILGMIYDSEVFPGQQPKGSCVLTVMVGGAKFPDHASMPVDEMIQFAIDKAEQHLKISKQPTSTMAVQHKDCIPQYGLGHQELVREARDHIAVSMPHLRIFGNSFDGVGLADSISHARKAVESIKLDAHLAFK